MVLPALRRRRTKLRPSAPGSPTSITAMANSSFDQRGLGGFGAGDPVYGIIRGGQAARDGVGDDVIVFYD